MEIGAGDGNRTHAICLGSKSSAIELHPPETTRDSDDVRQKNWLCSYLALDIAQLILALGNSKKPDNNLF